jgi:surface antigen
LIENGSFIEMRFVMKKTMISILSVAALTACAQTGNLRPGEVLGTGIGSILAEEAGLNLSRPNEDKMNTEIDKALFFSDDGLTTSWYAGINARIRPTGVYRDRRDRDCRRFRHGITIDGQWYNGSAIACRERNVAWYLISNQWDRVPDRGDDRRDNERPRRSIESNKGNWENLSDELSGNLADSANDDFGPRNNTHRW